MTGTVAIVNYRDLCAVGVDARNGEEMYGRCASYDIWIDAGGAAAGDADAGELVGSTPARILHKHVAEQFVCRPGGNLPEPEGRRAKTWRRGLGQSGTRADRILFTGDIHDKAARLCPLVSEAADRTDAGTIVVLGDLLNEWDIAAPAEVAAFRRFAAWVRDERRRRDVVVLLGNHDIAYYADAGTKAHRSAGDTCPGYNAQAYPEVHGELLALEPRVMFGFADAKGRQVLASHAGLTNGWYEWMMGCLAAVWALGAATLPVSPTAEQVAAQVNAFALGGRDVDGGAGNTGIVNGGAGNASRIDGLHALGAMVGPERGGWHGGIPSPVWTGKEELARDPLPGFNQIVGHSPVPTVEHRRCGPGTGPLTRSGARSRRAQAELWYCDTHSLMRDGRAIGDDAFLLYDRAAGDAWAVRAAR